MPYLIRSKEMRKSQFRHLGGMKGGTFMPQTWNKQLQLWTGNVMDLNVLIEGRKVKIK